MANDVKFTDRQLRLIEYCVSHLVGDGVFKEGFTPEELNDVWLICKQQRLKNDYGIDPK